MNPRYHLRAKGAREMQQMNSITQAVEQLRALPLGWMSGRGFQEHRTGTHQGVHRALAKTVGSGFAAASNAVLSDKTEDMKAAMMS